MRSAISLLQTGVAVMLWGTIGVCAGLLFLVLGVLGLIVGCLWWLFKIPARVIG